MMFRGDWYEKVPNDLDETLNVSRQMKVNKFMLNLLLVLGRLNFSCACRNTHPIFLSKMNKSQITTYSVSIDGGCLELNPRNGKWPHITDCNPRITIDIGIPSSRTLILSKYNLRVLAREILPFGQVSLV